jgi:hypothetical protein
MLKKEFMLVLWTADCTIQPGLYWTYVNICVMAPVETGFVPEPVRVGVTMDQVALGIVNVMLQREDTQYGVHVMRLGCWLSWLLISASAKISVYLDVLWDVAVRCDRDNASCKLHNGMTLPSEVPCFVSFPGITQGKLRIQGANWSAGHFVFRSMRFSE